MRFSVQMSQQYKLEHLLALDRRVNGVCLAL